MQPTVVTCVPEGDANPCSQCWRGKTTVKVDDELEISRLQEPTRMRRTEQKDHFFYRGLTTSVYVGATGGRCESGARVRRRQGRGLP